MRITLAMACRRRVVAAFIVTIVPQTARIVVIARWFRRKLTAMRTHTVGRRLIGARRVMAHTRLCKTPAAVIFVRMAQINQKRGLWYKFSYTVFQVVMTRIISVRPFAIFIALALIKSPGRGSRAAA